jgi:hypothetical protein
VHEDIKMAEVPIPYSERLGRSKLSVIRDGSEFLQSILWTVLAYNPVRVLGIIGLVGVAFAGAVMLGLAGTRLTGVTNLGPWGVTALYASLVAGVAGISIFSLGATFNYLVSLFYKRPIRQGLFGRPLMKKPLERRFGVLGVLALIAGLIIAGTSLILGINGWVIGRLWLYLLGSAMLILVGVQLIIYWVLMRVLEELNRKDILAQKDLEAA